MKKKDDRLRGVLLSLAKERMEQGGPDGINIRDLAKHAGIATGTVYNYFANKDDILIALTEEYWLGVLQELQEHVKGTSFARLLEEAYVFLKKHMDASAKALMGSLRHIEALGRQRMRMVQQQLLSQILAWVESDPDIKTTVWDAYLSREEFAGFILTNMVFALQVEQRDIHVLLEVVKRTLY